MPTSNVFGDGAVVTEYVNNICVNVKLSGATQGNATPPLLPAIAKPIFPYPYVLNPSSAKYVFCVGVVIRAINEIPH